MEYQIHTLKNGIRILFKPEVSTISHAGIIINAGSRDEEANKAGVAHFIEHLLFKGTYKRNTNQILNRLEMVGGDLNAYTTKEYTCIHASFLSNYFDRATELISDIVFNSTFPECEIEKEKSVVLDEITSYEDQPEEAINDEFESILFKNNPLGNNILGDRISVNEFNLSDIRKFIDKNYNTNEIVFAISGNYSFKNVIKICEKYFGLFPENNSKKNRIFQRNYVDHQEVINYKPINQLHCVLGNIAYSYHDQLKYGMLLLNNFLGGNGMSSRLNLQIREKYGIAYHIESNYTPFSDTGIFNIYFGTDDEKAKKANDIILKELGKLRNNKIGSQQLATAKKKFIGQIALAEENRLGVLLSMTKSLIDFNKIDSLKEVFSRINAVTASDILHISNEIFEPKNLIYLWYKPNKN